MLPCRPLPTQLFQARDGTLAVEDMDGGTFTISNGGVFGSLYGTPIINPPQSAILGMHGVFDRPVAINKQVSIVKMKLVCVCVCVRACVYMCVRVHARARVCGKEYLWFMLTYLSLSG